MVAHPDEDGLDTVMQEEAVGIVAFLDELLRFMYGSPDRLANLKARASPRRPKIVEEP